MGTKEFSYRRSPLGLIFRAIEMVLRIVGIFLFLLCSSRSLIALANNEELPMDILLIPISLLLIALTTYTNMPDIKIGDDGLFVYISWRWIRLAWNTISGRRYSGETFLIASSELPPVYIWMGLGVWPGRRCFLVSASVLSFSRFIDLKEFHCHVEDSTAN